MTAGDMMIVDDDQRFLSRLERALSQRGYGVRAAKDAEEAFKLIEQSPPQFAIVDLKMPGETGLAVVTLLMERNPAARAVVLTGYGSIATAVEAVRRGAVDYLTKPADIDHILRMLTGDPVDDRSGENEYEVPSLERVEWEHINRVLTEHEGNISKTAKALGLHRRSLQRKLQKAPLG